MRFVCRNCSYRFEMEPERAKKICPYCGRDSVTKEPDADELLNETD